MEDVEDWDEEEETRQCDPLPGGDELTAHEILREKSVGSGADFMVRCEACQHVHTIEFRPPPHATSPSF